MSDEDFPFRRAVRESLPDQIFLGFVGLLVVGIILWAVFN